jgi:hypothetical protein
VFDKLPPEAVKVTEVAVDAVTVPVTCVVAPFVVVVDAVTVLPMTGALAFDPGTQYVPAGRPAERPGTT